MHYASAKTRDNDRSLYELLRNVTVSQSAGISKSIRLVQSSEVHTVEQSRASFHLEETENRLNLFVPTDKRDRELCFLHQLPKQMLHFLSVTDPMALAVLVKIMGCSNLDTLDSVLEVDGIIEVDGVSREDRSVDDLGSIFNRALSFAEDRTRNSAWRDSSMAVPSTPFTPAMTSIPTLGNVHERGENRQRQDSLIGATRISSPMTTNTKAPSYADSSSVPTSTISHATSPPLDSPNENGVPEADKTTFREYVERDIATSQLAKFVTMTAQEHYRNFSLEELRLAHYSRQSRSGNTYGALLDRIITKARAGLLGQVFPRKGQAPLEISDEVATKVFGPRSLDRDRKVGAAGELFVSFHTFTPQHKTLMPETHPRLSRDFLLWGYHGSISETGEAQYEKKSKQAINIMKSAPGSALRRRTSCMKTRKAGSRMNFASSATWIRKIRSRRPPHTTWRSRPPQENSMSRST